MGNGSGRGFRRAPSPRPSLAGGRCALAAFGPAWGELAVHHRSLSTGRTAPPAREPAPPIAQVHAAAAPDQRRSPAPTHWSWVRPEPLASRSCAKALGSRPRKGLPEPTRAPRVAVNDIRREVSAVAACRSGVFRSRPPASRIFVIIATSGSRQYASEVRERPSCAGHTRYSAAIHPVLSRVTGPRRRSSRPAVRSAGTGAGSHPRPGPAAR